MTQVIYADVLVVLNTYVTYILLLLTAIISHEKINRLPFVLSALCGGFSALLILVPEISEAALSTIRLFAAAVFLLIAFGKGKVRRFIRLYCCFFAVNFLFAGLMLVLWYLAKPGRMYFSSSILYFDIDTFSLVALTAVCYLIIRIMSRFITIKSPIGRIYDVEIFLDGKSVRIKGFLDTGNNLKDPFTSKPVLIADKKSIVPLGNEKGGFSAEKLRYIPCTTVSGGDMLPCFRADKVRINGVSCRFDVEGVFIGITNSKIKNGEYDILLCDAVFDNKTNESGGDYAIQSENVV